MRDFAMDANTLDYMLALLGPWRYRQIGYPLWANLNGVPWSRHDFGYPTLQS